MLIYLTNAILYHTLLYSILYPVLYTCNSSLTLQQQQLQQQQQACLLLLALTQLALTSISIFHTIYLNYPSMNLSFES